MPLSGIRIALLAGLTLFLGFGSLRAETVRDEALGFKFEVPSKWKVKALPSGERTMIHQYADREASALDPATVVMFIRKHQIVAQGQQLDVEDFLAGTGLEGAISQLGIQMDELIWRGLPMPRIRAALPSAGGRMVMYSVCYPFSGEAVQLQVAGPENRDTEVRAIFEQVAQSVENLRPLAGTRPAAARNSGGALMTVVFVMVVLVGAAVVVAMRLQKRAQMRMAAEESAGL